jgi:flagellar biosynthesis regulator FlaF
MSHARQAVRAYSAAAAARDPREQEAEVFRHANAVLRRAHQGDARMRVRALADNRRLWSAVIDLVRDPDNALPAPLRAAIVSVGLAVQREMGRAEPDFAFLIAVNENIAAGLSRAG